MGIKYRGRVGQAIIPLIIFILFAAAVLYIALPVISVFMREPLSGILESLGDPMVVDALKLSLFTTAISSAIVIAVGTPISYVNARYGYRGKELVDTIVDLPVVMPPAVAGIALLMAFGRKGILGQYFDLLGISIAFSTIAVIMAQVFVASPFYIRQARTSFEDVNRSYEDAARTLGASPLRTFFYVTVPIAMNGLISGAILSWARALGEFGATIMFAGNFQGRTQTMPLAIYTAMQGDIGSSLFLSMILVIISFIVIVTVKMLTRRGLILAKD